MCLEKILGLFFKPREVPISIEQHKSEPDILSNKWRVVSAIELEDKDHILMVTYSNELGMENEDHCMVIFESSTEYKLVSPELGSGKILQKANIVSLSIEKIVKTP